MILLLGDHLIAKGQLATIRYDTAPRPQKSYSANPNLEPTIIWAISKLDNKSYFPSLPKLIRPFDCINNFIILQYTNCTESIGQLDNYIKKSRPKKLNLISCN